MVNKKVFETLRPLGYPVQWQKRPQVKDRPVISYHFFNESGQFYGNGKALISGGSVQIDVFSKAGFGEAVEKIKHAMAAGGFLFQEAWEDVEELDNTTELYHKIMIFNYSEMG